MDSLDRHDDYARSALDEAQLAPDPLAQFAAWLTEAERADVPTPNAMVLSTLDADGPASRTVLLKGVVDGRFEFVTGAESRKGRALQRDGRVALLFPWYALERQVEVDGDAAPALAELSDAYWATRPRGSQVAAWASEQSRPIPDRPALEARVREVESRFTAVEVIPLPRPPGWGAWLVTPRRIEFWQGRASRLHDRLVYTPDAGGWRIQRLQP